MKYKIWSVSIATLLCLFGAAPVRATIMGIDAGNLIKIKSDGNPATPEDETVYYYDRDWHRRPFLNRSVYESWYRDFSGVKEISAAEMASIRMAAPITYRPGTRLIKIPSVPKVYAVEPGGVLRWITSEAVARELYGADWSKRVVDVPESYFANYREGAPLIAPVWPTGTFVRRAADAALYLIDGLTKRHVSPDVAISVRLNDADVVPTAVDLAFYADAGELMSGEVKLTDTSQDQRLETIAAPVFAFDAPPAAKRGSEAVLYRLQLVGGSSLILRRLRVTISGPLRTVGLPNLTSLKWVNAAGENLYGTQELQGEAASETSTWTGAYALPAESLGVVELRATTAAGLAVGSKFQVSLDRSAVLVADGGNGDNLLNFYPFTSFPTQETLVE